MQKLKVFLSPRYVIDAEDKSFREAADRVGLEFVTIDQANFLLCLDLAKGVTKQQIFQRFDASRRALILREPWQVLPAAYQSRIRAKFSSCVQVGDVTHEKFFPWPQQLAPIESVTEPALRAVAIASWRVSFLKGSHYNLRAKAFSRLEVDTYGRGWNSSALGKLREIVYQFWLAIRNLRNARLYIAQLLLKPKNLKGELSSKTELIGKYHCTLVIENSSGYISEKLFEAISSGLIPIYCGAPLERLALPEGLVIECHPNLASLERGIEEAFSVNYREWLSKANTWVESQTRLGVLGATNAWARILGEIRTNWERSL